MYGTLAGNLAGAIYYFYFQAVGLALVFCLFPWEKGLAKWLTGSVLGVLLMTWLPVLFAFAWDFTLPAHVAAAIAVLPPLSLALFRRRGVRSRLNWRRLLRGGWKRHGLFFGALAFFMALWGFLLCTHTLLPGEDSAFYTGQSTYGDMSMHLGFITSLARQKTFPPDYSIMPGVRLAYPFLSDSISSSLLLWGASLRFAYVLPMLFAAAQIFTAVYLFAGTVYRVLKKPAVPAAMLALLLFFGNGGLGFVYFLDWSRERVYHFEDIFKGFYTTPTNLVDRNIRWVNVVADMFLPQRATLFGYAVLFPALWLLYRAAFGARREFFPVAGLFVAALPMIHTHSFLSAGVVSAVWMALWLYRERFPAGGSSLADRRRRFPRFSGAWILALFTGVMCLLQCWNRTGEIAPRAFLCLGVGLYGGAAAAGIVLLVSYVRRSGWSGGALPGWGRYLACIFVLAMPQLLFWTFGQVSQGGFVRGHFNWGNQGDLYLWFYLKNIGVPLVLIVGGACACDRKRAPLFLPALFLWWLGELIVFTPNTYDNNKLLYVAYLLLCIGAADYAVSLARKIAAWYPGRRLPGTVYVLFILLLFCSVFSGALTLGREAVSRYQLYGASQVKLAEYVEEHTPMDAVFLTGTRHNNEIASLAGRNIVCGADTFLYFHGLDTEGRKADIRLMYEAPLEQGALYEKYKVSYIVISSYERSSYAIDEDVFRAHFEEVYSGGGVALYRWREERK